MSDVSEASVYQLAVLRTELSNSSTLLAHMQGAVAFLISAIGVAKFLDSFWLFDLCGFGLTGLAFFVFLRGIRLFRRTRSTIEEEKANVHRLFGDGRYEKGG